MSENQQVFMLPDLGEGLTEAEVVEWLVAEGDEVVIDQNVVTVETAKATVEVPIPFAGTVAVLREAFLSSFVLELVAMLGMRPEIDPRIVTPAAETEAPAAPAAPAPAAAAAPPPWPAATAPRSPVAPRRPPRRSAADGP